MSAERHQIHAESAGAWVLGALDDVAAESFVRHLEECPVCRDEVQRLRPAVDALARSVPQMEAPTALKGSIMREVEADVARAAGRERPRRSFAAGLRERLGAAVSGLAPRHALAVAAVGIVAFVAAAGIVATGGDGGGQASTRTVAAKFDRRQMPGANGNLVIAGGGDAGATLRVHGMPSLPPSRTYQVWIQRGGETIPKALFAVGSDGTGLTAVDGDVRGADAVLITREAAGGARSPSEKPVVRIPLRS